MKIIPLRAFKDNYIWLFQAENSSSVWVVDPGDAAPVIKALKENHFTLSGILITHHHADHTGGIKDLIHYAGNVPVYGSVISPIAEINQRVKEGDIVHCGPYPFSVLEIPGTP